MVDKPNQIQELINQNSILLEKIESQNDSLLLYQQILEKTNDQLSLWSNPYGVMVGTLTLIVGLLTISTTLIIAWNNRKHKKLIQEELEKLLKNEKKQAFKEINQRKEDLKQELKSASDQEKEKIEDKLEMLSDKEFELKTNLPDLNQYMKKSDFLCKRCRDKSEDPYSVLNSSYLHGLYPPISINGRYGVHKIKCVSCGENI